MLLEPLGRPAADFLASTWSLRCSRLAKQTAWAWLTYHEVLARKMSGGETGWSGAYSAAGIVSNLTFPETSSCPDFPTPKAGSCCSGKVVANVYGHQRCNFDRKGEFGGAVLEQRGY